MTFGIILDLLVEECYIHRQTTPPNCSLNICLSDGCSTVATRYRSNGAIYSSSSSSSSSSSNQQPPSLYYSYGNEYYKKQGCFLNSFDISIPTDTTDDNNNNSSSSSSSSSDDDITTPMFESMAVDGVIITSAPLNRPQEEGQGML